METGERNHPRISLLHGRGQPEPALHSSFPNFHLGTRLSGAISIACLPSVSGGNRVGKGNYRSNGVPKWKLGNKWLVPTTPDVKGSRRPPGDGRKARSWGPSPGGRRLPSEVYLLTGILTPSSIHPKNTSYDQRSRQSKLYRNPPPTRFFVSAICCLIASP